MPDGFAPASVSFESPTNGSTVGNPVIMCVASTGVDHMEVWAGPYLLAHHLVANPVNVGYRFQTIGTRTITARGYSDAGALLATDSVSITVENVGSRGPGRPFGLCREWWRPRRRRAFDRALEGMRAWSVCCSGWVRPTPEPS